VSRAKRFRIDSGSKEINKEKKVDIMKKIGKKSLEFLVVVDRQFRLKIIGIKFIDAWIKSQQIFNFESK